MAGLNFSRVPSLEAGNKALALPALPSNTQKINEENSSFTTSMDGVKDKVCSSVNRHMQSLCGGVKKAASRIYSGVLKVMFAVQDFFRAIGRAILKAFNSARLLTFRVLGGSRKSCFPKGQLVEKNNQQNLKAVCLHSGTQTLFKQETQSPLAIEFPKRLAIEWPKKQEEVSVAEKKVSHKAPNQDLSKQPVKTDEPVASRTRSKTNRKKSTKRNWDQPAAASVHKMTLRNRSIRVA